MIKINNSVEQFGTLQVCDQTLVARGTSVRPHEPSNDVASRNCTDQSRHSQEYVHYDEWPR